MTCDRDYNNDNNNHWNCTWPVIMIILMILKITKSVHDLLEGGALVDGVVLQHRLQSHHHQWSYWDQTIQMYDWIKTLRNKNSRHWYFADQIEEKFPFYIFWLSVQNPTTTTWNHCNFGQNIFAHGMHPLLFQYIFVILLIPMSSLLSVLSPLYFCDKHHHHMKGIAPPVHHHLNGNKDKLTSRPGLPASEDLSDCWDPGRSYLGSCILCTTCILYG